MLTRPFEAFANEVDIRLGGANARWRFFLERMEDVDEALETYCINGPVGAAVEALNDFKDAGSLTFPWLGTRMLATKLRDAERMAHVAQDVCRECK